MWVSRVCWSSSIRYTHLYTDLPVQERGQVVGEQGVLVQLYQMEVAGLGQRAGPLQAVTGWPLRQGRLQQLEADVQ